MKPTVICPCGATVEQSTGVGRPRKYCISCAPADRSRQRRRRGKRSLRYQRESKTVRAVADALVAIYLDFAPPTLERMAVVADVPVAQLFAAIRRRSDQALVDARAQARHGTSKTEVLLEEFGHKANQMATLVTREMARS